MEFLADPATWTAVCLLIFIGLIVMLGVPGQMAKALDKRSDGIRTELDEARKLREEAQTLLSNYQRQERDAAKEAEEIIAAAREEAARAVEESREDLKTFIARRRQQAEGKIARAEEQAVADIRNYAATVSVGAAQRFIRGQMTPDRSAKMIDGAVARLPESLRAHQGQS